MERRPLPPAWDELLRTGSAVRATAAAPDEAPRDPGRLRQAVRPVAVSATLLTAALASRTAELARARAQR